MNDIARIRLDHPAAAPRTAGAGWRGIALAATLALVAAGCGSGSDGADATTTTGSAANPTTPSGEGAGGGPAPDTSSITVPDIPGGESVAVSGTLSGVQSSPDEEYINCTYLTTPDGVLALETSASQYEMLTNVVPLQLEIKDAETGEPVAGLGDTVRVEGVQHPEPTPIGGESYGCEGATAYLRVSSIERTS